MNKEPLIVVNHLSKEFSNVTPLKDVSATIYKGDIISIIGPSGTGKSTFLRCLNHLETPTSGQIIIDGEDLSDDKVDINKVRQKMGMVFQSFNLFSHKKVIENIMMGQIDLLKISPQEAFDNSLKLLELVGLKDKAYSLPEELSGGQKQRVAIARTLSMQPEIILFDEPTSALDPTMVDEVLNVIRELARNGMTMLIVTHEMNFARHVSNRIFYMDEGIIYEDGSPEQIFEHPEKDKTRQFINKLKTFSIIFDKKNVDLQDSNNKTVDFCRKNYINPVLAYRLRLVEEEICFNHLMKIAEDKVTLNVEYDPQKECIFVNILYDGEEFDFENNLDEVEAKLINGIISNVKKQRKDNHQGIYFEVK